MKATFLSDNKTEDTRCTAEWGLSILVESGGHKVLYDTGFSDMFSRNAEAIGVDLKAIECCMISHGHDDHTNGIEAFLKINRTAPVYIHKSGFDMEFAQENGLPVGEDCGIHLSEAFVKEMENAGRIVKTEGIVKINDCMTLVGNIPVPDDFRFTESFLKRIDGRYVIDNMEHEQFLAVTEGDRVHIISGCSHRGIINILNYAKELFPDKKIGALMGGFHTYPMGKAERERFAKALVEYKIEKVVPLHCTGIQTIVALKAKMGDDCIICCAGDSIEV